jgi:hypothetical protein
MKFAVSALALGIALAAPPLAAQRRRGGRRFVAQAEKEGLAPAITGRASRGSMPPGEH